MVSIASEGLALEMLKDLLKKVAGYSSLQIPRFTGMLNLIHFALWLSDRKGISGFEEIISLKANSEEKTRMATMEISMIFFN
jgi:hypothetical protein